MLKVRTKYIQVYLKYKCKVHTKYLELIHKINKVYTKCTWSIQKVWISTQSRYRVYIKYMYTYTYTDIYIYIYVKCIYSITVHTNT